MTVSLRVAPLARAGKRAAVPLVAALYLCACGDSGTVPTPSPPPPPAPVAAPSVANQLPDLELTVRGSLVVVDFSPAISGVVSEWSATSSNTNVAVVSVGEGGRAEVAPVSAGAAQITVTARNAGGVAETTFTVRVVPQGATAPPTVAGALQSVTLSLGEGSAPVDLAGAFSPPGFTLTLRTLNPGIVTAAVSGTTAILTPVSQGSSAIEITAHNAAGSLTRTLPVTVVARPAATGSLEPLALVAGSAPTVIDLSTAFSPPTGLSFQATSDDEEIVTAAVVGRELTVTPLAPGNTAITVTARSAAGSATSTIPVIVVGENQATAPAPAGTLPPLMLGTGSGPVFVDVGAAFTPRGFRLEARSLNPGVATVSVHADTALRVTPAGAGRTTIEVTASNSFGSGSRQLQVEVVGPPRVSGTIRPVSLTIGAPPEVVDLRNAFSPAGSQVTARSLNERVVTISVGEGSSLTLTPVAAGNTSVEVTAHNAGGSTTRTIRVTVAAAAPRAVGTFAPVALSLGGARADVDVAHAFTPAGVPVEARSRNTGIVAATLNGSVVTLTPVGSGNTSVDVTARNASGSANLSISVAVAAAAPTAPVAVGTLAPVSLFVGGAAVDVDVAAAFTPAGVPIETRSLNTGFVTATVNGSVVILTPAGEGSTSVEVTARNASGSATLSIAVTVAATAPTAPVAVGTVDPISFSAGGAAVDLNVAAAFTPAGVPIEARSLNTGVVNATVNGSVVTLTPVGPGNTSVEVTARNASGFATLSIAVTVAAAAPPAPVAVGTLTPISFSVGGAAVEVDVAAAFTPAGVPIEARSLNTGVATATVNGSVVTLTPVGDGSTSVEVTARNASGSATLSIEVTVAAAAPEAPRAVGGYSTIHLAVGGTARRLDMQRGFTPAGLPLEARSLDTGVVTVAVNGSVVTLTPVGPGAASVEVTATNASGSATLTLRMTAASAAPEAVGTPDPLSLPAGGAAVEIDVTDLFTPTAVSYGYISRNPGIVSADLRGSILTLTPGSAGTTSVEVGATNALGRASQTFSVTVTGTTAPRAVGTLAPVSLTVGGAAAKVDVADAFTPAGFTVRVSTGRETVATVAVNGTVITITPVGEGTTRVYVDVSNGSGTARQRISVTVAADTSATVDLADVTLSVGGATLDVDVSRAFAFASFTVEASSRDTGVVTVEVSGKVLTLTPVSAGTTYVNVRARTDSTSSGKGFYVTVYPVAPQAVGTLEPVTLMVEGPAVEVDVADAFTPADVTISARHTSNTGNVGVTVAGTVVTITPRSAGNNAVQVTARNSAGSATQTFLVTVLPIPPEAVGTVDAVALVDGGASVQRNFRDAFEGFWRSTLDARSNDTGIVTAAMDDRDVRWAVFTPVGVGSTTVVVTARNAGGSASHTVSVSVVTAVPQAIGTPDPSTIALGGSAIAVLIPVANIFTPETVRVEAVSNNTEVVTVEVTADALDKAPYVRATPVGLGTTTVEITGSTADGSATAMWEITVVAPR